MRNLPAVPKPETPAFFDVVIGQVQDTLKEKLPWLNYSFGRSQRLVEERNRKAFHYPGVHIKKGKYQNLLPDQSLGNFSFFIMHDPQELEMVPHILNTVSAKFSLVFWVNLDKIFTGVDDRSTEAVKAQILKVLTRELFLKSGKLSVSEISERAENVYKEYDLKEVDSQYVMQPFAGFRFEGTMLLRESC